MGLVLVNAIPWSNLSHNVVIEKCNEYRYMHSLLANYFQVKNNPILNENQNFRYYFSDFHWYSRRMINGPRIFTSLWKYGLILTSFVIFTMKDIYKRINRFVHNIQRTCIFQCFQISKCYDRLTYYTVKNVSR